jgi:hypothetical protein
LFFKPNKVSKARSSLFIYLYIYIYMIISSMLETTVCCFAAKDQSQLAFSTSQLKTLQFLHLTPINRVVFPWPNGEYSSWGGFPTYMLSAVIRSERDYSAFTVGTITDTSVVHPKKSSRTIFGSPQYSSAYTGYGPNCFTTF